MLIAVAGPDGAGKTTLSWALRDALRARGIHAVRLDRFDILDPKLSPASAFIKTDVLTVRQSVMAMPAAQSRLLFILWSIAIATASQLKDGPPNCVLIHDSYWMKHTAAEIIFGAEEAAALAAASLLPQPDLTLYVKLPPETLLARKPDDRVAYECGMDETCSSDSFLSHQRQIQAHLDAWSRRFGWMEVDGDRPLAVLVEDMVGRIAAAIPPPADR